MPQLNVSIVLFRTPFEEVERLVAALRRSGSVGRIFLVDNSPARDERFGRLPAVYVFNNRNLGYGAAHNIAIRHTLDEDLPYHLVINADVQMQPEVLDKMLHFMHKNPKIALSVPKTLYPDGKIQYICKLLPTPFYLWGRRFLPERWMRRRTAVYELHWSGYDRIMNVPYLQGSFMLLRTEALRQTGLFDERFFMYPEDIDLTRRLHRRYETVFFPEVSVVHAHGRGSYKSYRLLWIHIVNMCRYFNKWGWWSDKERREFNRRCIGSYLPSEK